MHPRHSSLITGRTLATLLLIVAAAMTLLAVLPYAMQSSSHPRVQILWFTHIGILCLATAIAGSTISDLVRRSRWPTIGVGAGFLGLLAVITLLGTLPVTDLRALDVHLAVPKNWLRTGAIELNLWEPRSLYPALTELAYLGFIQLDAIHLIALYLTLYLIVCAGLIARFVEYRTHRAEPALVAGIIALTVPALIRAVNDLAPAAPLALYLTVTLLILAARLDGDRRRGLLLLAGGSLGFAGATAPDGFLAAPVILVAYGWAARRSDHPLRQRLGVYTWLTAGMILTLAPWLIRNGWWISNPFFPLGGDLLGSNALLAGDGWRLDLPGALRAVLANPWGILSGPLEILFVARDEAASRFDGMATPLFAFAFIGVWSYRRHPWVAFFGLFMLLTYVSALLFERYALRDLATLLLPATSLAVLGLGRFALAFKRRFERRVVTFLITAHLVYVAAYLGARLIETGAIEYRRSHSTPAEYLTTRIPAYAMIDFINRSIEPSRYILSLFAGGALSYYDPRVVTGGTSPTGHLAEWLATTQSGRSLAREFTARGLDYLVADENALEAALAEQVGESALSRWRDFLTHHTTVRHTAGGLTLREVGVSAPPGRDSESTGPTAPPVGRAPSESLLNTGKMALPLFATPSTPPG